MVHILYALLCEEEKTNLPSNAHKNTSNKKIKVIYIP